MSSRKNLWNSKLDQHLLVLSAQFKNKKWNQIAEIINETNNFQKYTGKLCRERYFNHLDPNLQKKTQWNIQQQQQLIQMHSKFGNKWAYIAQHLIGRTANAVRNQYYSKMRKILQFSNRNIHKYLRSKCRQVKITFIYRLIETTQQRYKPDSRISEQIINLSHLIKDRMISYWFIENDSQLNSTQIAALEELIKDVNYFNKINKRWPRKNKLSQKTNMSNNSFSQKQQKIQSNKFINKNQFKLVGNFSRQLGRQKIDQKEIIEKDKAKLEGYKIQRNHDYKVQLTDLPKMPLEESRIQLENYKISLLNTNFFIPPLQLQRQLQQTIQLKNPGISKQTGVNLNELFYQQYCDQIHSYNTQDNSNNNNYNNNHNNYGQILNGMKQENQNSWLKFIN